MRDYTTKPPTYSEYDGYSHVWKPREEGDQSLFLIRVPSDLEQMSLELYRHLMAHRGQWLIHAWIKQSGEDQTQTAQRLSRALACLNLDLDPPDLNIWGESRLRDESEWAAEWGYTLIYLDPTLMNKFEITNSRLFPIPVHLPSSPTVQADFQVEHDYEITLENWLSFLIADMC